MTYRTWLTLIGVLFILGGGLIAWNPLPALLTLNALAGVIFLILGLALVGGAFRLRRTPFGIGLLLLGGIIALIGLALLRNPLAGMVAVTVIVAISLLISGLVKLRIGRGLADPRAGWATMASGAVSAVLAVVVLANLPESAQVLLGVLLGVELISTGVAALVMSRTFGR